MVTGRRILLALGLLLVLTVGATGALMVQGSHETRAWRRAAPPEAPDSPLPNPPESLPQLVALLESFSRDWDAYAELRDQLNPEPPEDRPWAPEELATWRRLEHELDTLEAWTAHGGVRLPALVAWDTPDEDVLYLVPLQNLARAAMLRAWEALEAGRPLDAADDLILGLRLGVILEHAGPTALGAMVGVACQSISLKAIGPMIARPELWTEPALARLADALSTLNALPSGFPAAVAGECKTAGTLWRDLEGRSFNDMMATASGNHGEGGRPMPGLLFDAEATREMAFHQCQQHLDQLVKERWRRADVVEHEYWSSPPKPHQALSNPIGRILLDLGRFPWTSLDERVERARAGRRALELLVAFRRAEAAGEAPVDAEQLVPRWLPAVPRDPFADAPLGWDAEARRVESEGWSRGGEPMRWGLDGSGPLERTKRPPLPDNAG